MKKHLQELFNKNTIILLLSIINIIIGITFYKVYNNNTKDIINLNKLEYYTIDKYNNNVNIYTTNGNQYKLTYNLQSIKDLNANLVDIEYK